MIANGKPLLADKFAVLIRFLERNPGSASVGRGKNAPKIGSLEFITKAATNFATTREPKRPEPPATIPDELVSFILHRYFDLPEASLKRAQHEHSLSMGAENMVGDLLERYLATILEPRGWVWCSGSSIKSVDFIKPPASNKGKWIILQVKNRDNSENSSSSAIRKGTLIEKWHRTFSKKAGSNWAAFPDTSCRPLLSEEKFKEFVRAHLLALKKI